MKKKFNIICFSNIDWGFIYQRHQHIMNTFAEFDCVDKIIYVETLGTRTVKFNKEDFKRIIKKVSTLFRKKNVEESFIKNINPKISIVTPLAIPLFCPLFFYINEKLLENKLNKKLEKLNINLEDTIVWVNLSHPSVYKYVKKRKFKKVIYDCIDDIKSIPKMNKSIVKCEKQFIKYADIVFATSKNLYDSCKKIKDKVILLPNGVSKNLVTKRPNNINNDNKVVGYVGTVYEWFDDNLLYECAKAYPEVNFCIVGPVRINIDRFKSLDNVIFKGKVSYDEVENYIENFDVCLIPFKINELTLNTNPVKVFEYFSKGKPVVSTDIPELRKYSKSMYIARSGLDFVKKVRKALTENNLEVYNKRISIANMNTWERRVELVIKSINDIENQGVQDEY